MPREVPQLPDGKYLNIFSGPRILTEPCGVSWPQSQSRAPQNCKFYQCFAQRGSLIFAEAGHAIDGR